MNGGTGLTSAGANGQFLTSTASGTLTWTSSSSVPYAGATGSVNLGSFDLTVNGLTVGRGAGALSTNTANGSSALYSNTTGSNLTANGFNSLRSNTTGASNTANGSSSLQSNTTGNHNTGTGESTLFSNTTGYQNTANGAGALRVNTIGYNNTANGSFSLYKNTTGGENTANGANSLYSNTTGQQNTANGTNSLNSNTTGSYNTASGNSTLSANTTGDFNTANGYVSMQSNTTGYSNSAYGSYSLIQNTSGNENTAFGYSSMYSNTTGNYNTVLGHRAGYTNTIGNKNTIIGYYADVLTNNLSNATAIGYGANVAASNTIQLGNTSVTNVKTSGKLTTGAVTYPNTNGTNGQYLKTDGEGTASWAPVSIADNSITSAKILDGEIVDADIASSAAIVDTKLATISTAGKVSNSATSATIANESNTIVLRDVWGSFQAGNITAAGVSSSGDINVHGVTMGTPGGTGNTRIGAATFAYVTSIGDNNTVLGNFAFTSSSGNSNTAIGSNAIRQGGVSSGDENTAVGVAALTNAHSGFRNTGVGVYTLNASIGTNNSSLGYYAGGNVSTGNFNTFIGSNADVQTGSGAITNATAIGYNAKVSVANTIQLGNTDVTDVKTSGTITAGAVTYPKVDGANGQVLITNGSGVASWSSPSILYQKTLNSLTLTNTVQNLASLSLPAGSYLVTYTGMAYKGGSSAEYVASRIAITSPGNLGGQDAIMINGTVNDGRAYVVHQLTITLATAGSVSVYANNIYGTTDAYLLNSLLTAVQVGSVIDQ